MAIKDTERAKLEMELNLAKGRLGTLQNSLPMSKNLQDNIQKQEKLIAELERKLAA
jgi:hypothetical protein